MLQQLEVAHHARAGVEHDDHGNRLHLVFEQLNLLRFLVVQDLEVRFDEIGDEALLRVDHCGIHGDNPRAGAKHTLLSEDGYSTRCQEGSGKALGS